MDINEINAKAKEVIDSLLIEAKSLIEEPSRITELLKKAEEKLTRTSLCDDLKEIPTLIKMIASYVKKEYRNIPAKTLAAVVAAVIYWVNPMDIIPDIVPVFGYVDDAAVLALLMKIASEDIKSFKAWAKENKK